MLLLRMLLLLLPPPLLLLTCASLPLLLWDLSNSSRHLKTLDVEPPAPILPIGWSRPKWLFSGWGSEGSFSSGGSDGGVLEESRSDISSPDKIVWRRRLLLCGFGSRRLSQHSEDDDDDAEQVRRRERHIWPAPRPTPRKS